MHVSEAISQSVLSSQRFQGAAAGLTATGSLPQCFKGK